MKPKTFQSAYSKFILSTNLIKQILFTLILSLLQSNLMASENTEVTVFILNQMQAEGLIAASQYYKKLYPSVYYYMYFDPTFNSKKSDTLVIYFLKNPIKNIGRINSTSLSKNKNAFTITYSLTLKKVINSELNN